MVLRSTIPIIVFTKRDDKQADGPVPSLAVKSGPKVVQLSVRELAHSSLVWEQYPVRLLEHLLEG